jgi:hypothetical protein
MTEKQVADGSDGRTLRLDATDPIAQTLVAAVHAGDVAGVRRLLARRPGLANARLVDEQGRSARPLHAVTDWPGFFPNGPAIVAVLIAAGADPNVPVEGSWHAETPLHGTASNDDVEVARALIDAGADIEAPGASIGVTPLDDAVGYGCWQVARLLVEHGARARGLWQAAGLGLTPRVQEFLAVDPPPSAQDITDAFWQACHGGHRRLAEYLLARGADINGTPSWGDSRPLDVADSHDTNRGLLVSWLCEHGATKSSAGPPGASTTTDK